MIPTLTPALVVLTIKEIFTFLNSPEGQATIKRVREDADKFAEEIEKGVVRLEKVGSFFSKLKD